MTFYQMDDFFFIVPTYLKDKRLITVQEYSRSFEDVSSNTVIYFRGIPKEFRGNMTVLLEISDKDPLYSHCYQVKH